MFNENMILLSLRANVAVHWGVKTVAVLFCWRPCRRWTRWDYRHCHSLSVPVHKCMMIILHVYIVFYSIWAFILIYCCLYLSEVTNKRCSINQYPGLRTRGVNSYGNRTLCGEYKCLHTTGYLSDTNCHQFHTTVSQAIEKHVDNKRLNQRFLNDIFSLFCKLLIAISF